MKQIKVAAWVEGCDERLAAEVDMPEHMSANEVEAFVQEWAMSALRWKIIEEDDGWEIVRAA